jgi:sugar lactone lactonase YvrE
LVLTLSAPTLRADGGSTTLVRPPFKHNLGFNDLKQFHLTAYGGDDFVLDDPRGIATVKLAAKDAPGIGDDDEVTVLGVNAGRGEIIYNPTLVNLARFGARDMPAPGLRDPVGIAVDEGGLVAVGDRGNDRVVLLGFDADTRLRYLKSITLAASGRALSRPAGVAIASGRLYIADQGNDRVVVADTTGAVQRVFDRIEAPFGIDVIVGPVANYHDDAFVAVTEAGGRRLARLDLRAAATAATIAADYSAVAGAGGSFDYVAVDYYGNVWVSDAGTGCLFKFDRALRLLDRFECNGGSGGDGDLDEPRGLAIHRRLGQVFVAQRSGVSYYWVGTDILGLRARVRHPGDPVEVDVRFTLTERSAVSVALVADHGAEPLELARSVRMGPGNRRLVYPVDRDDLPCGVAQCTYSLEVRARATYASRESHEVMRSTPLRVEAR